jgi:hypothetical protein
MAAIVKGDCMKIDDVISVQKFTPLSKAVERIDSTAYLGKSLYCLGGGIYFYLTRFRIGKFEDNSDGPFLSGVFWAPDDGAVKRVTDLNIEEDSGAILRPPAVFLPTDVIPEYASILNWVKKMEPKVCQESASYRIAANGLFVHRTIETEKYTFYFRGANDDDHEPPYAILYKY